MNKKDFQSLHGFTDDFMVSLEYAVKLYGGKIVGIEQMTKETIKEKFKGGRNGRKEKTKRL